MNSIKQSHPYDEATYLKMASAGNLEAFNQLILAYENMAYHHAYALLGDAVLAEDVTQESFIKAFQSIHSFRGGSYRSWLLKIVTNSAYDIHRRSQRHATQPLFPGDEIGEEIDSPAWIADPAGSVQDIVEQNEFSKSIYKLIGELPEPYRTVLTLIDLHELDYAEAAEALKVPIGTIKSRLARARIRMSEMLQQVKNTPFCLYCLA